MIKIKAYNKIKCFPILFTAICLILFNTGCGLDVFYEINAPKQSGNVPVINDNSVDKKLFQFNTNIVKRDDFAIVGTDVYYKIYTNESDLKKEKDDLINASKSNVANAADKLMGRSGYGYEYQALRRQNSNDNVLIPCTSNLQNVKIRLTDFGDGAIKEYIASIIVDNKNIGVPVRYNNKSFNFGRNVKDIPSLDNDDVKGDSLPSDNKWHICMFAVSRGHDNAFTPYYSNITYLGSVTIDGDSPNN